MEKHVRFPHKQGPLFQKLGTCNYIFAIACNKCEKLFSTIVSIISPDDLTYINSETRSKHFDQEKNFHFFSSCKVLLIILKRSIFTITHYVVQYVWPYYIDAP